MAHVRGLGASLYRSIEWLGAGSAKKAPTLQNGDIAIIGSMRCAMLDGLIDIDQTLPGYCFGIF
jgi:hypothetical protein